MRRIYFDNNATTPLLPKVFEAMRPYLLESFGNASSIHQQGQQS
jgi:cysteine desulfurase